MVDRARVVAGGMAIATSIGAVAMPTGHAQTASARTVVESAAKMLGGRERIRAVRVQDPGSG
jgi:hypothetical protein